MKKMSELRMSLIILLIGVFLLSGCLFTKKVTVTFKTNGGTSIDDIVLAEGKTIDEIEEPTKKGYVFDGWYIGSEKFDLETEITEDITLVAKDVSILKGFSLVVHSLLSSLKISDSILSILSIFLGVSDITNIIINFNSMLQI